MHEQNVIHRDIKCANILMTNRGVLKYCDFGLSRSVVAGAKKLVMTPRVVTRWYRAPELLLGDQEYGFSVDVWSVGCCLAEILTENKPVFAGADDDDTFRKICVRLGTSSHIDPKKYAAMPHFKAVGHYISNSANSQTRKSDLGLENWLKENSDLISTRESLDQE